MSAPALSEPRQALFPAGVAELAGRYDGFLLDQWGVLHDGAIAHEGAVACLEALRAAGKPVVILSNSGRSGAENARQLAKFGFARELYDEVISAGDDARDALTARWAQFQPAARTTCVEGATFGEPPSYVEVLTCLEMKKP